MFTTDEKPGNGKYECTKCGEIVILNDKNKTLPTCTRCRNEDWDKKI